MKSNLYKLMLVIVVTTYPILSHSEYKAFTDGRYALAESLLDGKELITSLSIVQVTTNGNSFILVPAERNTKINAHGKFESNGTVSITYKVNEKHVIQYTSTTTNYNYAYGSFVETLNGQKHTGSWEMKKIHIPKETNKSNQIGTH